jgi:hypothetical protein
MQREIWTLAGSAGIVLADFAVVWHYLTVSVSGTKAYIYLDFRGEFIVFC